MPLISSVHPSHIAMKKISPCIVAATVLAAIFSQTVFTYAGLIGDSVRVTRKIPSSGFHFGPFEYLAQAGPVDRVALSAGNNHYLDIEDTSLLFYYGPASGSGGPFSPMEHYVLFEDLSPTAPTITGLSYETDLVGFLPSNISFTDHSVTVGTGGLNWSGGQHLTVNLQFIPEPSTLALLFTATLGGLLLWRRRR